MPQRRVLAPSLRRPRAPGAHRGRLATGPLLRQAVAGAFVLGAFACSSSSSAPPVTHGPADSGVDASKSKKDAEAKKDVAAPQPDTGPMGFDAPKPDVINDPLDCVAPGTASGEDGVGGYCSPGGGQCLHAGTGGTATLCTADFGAPAHEWFCTIPCMQQSDCGSGKCITAAFAQICVPTACIAAIAIDASLPDVSVPDAAGDAADATADARPVDGSHGDAKHDAAGADAGRPDAGHPDAASKDATPKDAGRGDAKGDAGAH
jgi:hypothetical protein